MKTLVSFLAAFALFGSVSTAQTVTSVSVDHIDHGSLRVIYTTSGTLYRDDNAAVYGNRIRYIASPGTCTGGTGGTVQSFSFTFNPMYQDIGGLQPNTQYQICPEVSADMNLWSSGVGVTVTTAPLPAIHPAPPVPPVTWNTDYPDTSAFFVASVDGACSNFASLMSAAEDRQATQGTVISVPAGTVCAPWTNSRAGNSTGIAKDAIVYHASNVNVGSSIITLDNTLASYSLVDGQDIIFGCSYWGGQPGNTSGNCTDRAMLMTAVQVGRPYMLHQTGLSSFQIYAHTINEDGTTGTQLVTFTSQGSGTPFFAPWPRRIYPIIVRTATPDSQFVPEHTRVSPAWASKMAIFKQTNLTTSLIAMGDSDGNVQYLLGNVRFVGIEFTTNDYTYARTSSDPKPWMNTFVMAANNNNVILDRCYIHYPANGNRVQKGFIWDGANEAIIDSYMDGLTYWHTAFEGLGLSGSNGAQSISLGSGTFHNVPGSPSTSIPNTTISWTGTGSGRMLLYTDFANSFKFTVAFPPGLVPNCGTGCVATTSSETEGGNAWGSYLCDRHDPGFPVDGAGDPAAGMIGCVDIDNGLVTKIVGASPQPQSNYNSEGSNFMLAGKGPGPWKMLDTYIQGAGLTVHHDDCNDDFPETGSPNYPLGCPYQRTDYSYIRNYFDFPFTFMYGHPLSDGFRYWTRQPLEWKGGQRILIKGNIFNNEWVEDNPVGPCIAMTARNGQQTITDVDIVDNTCQHAAGFLGLATAESTQAYTVAPMLRIRVKNNLFWDVNAGSPVLPGTGIVAPCSGYDPNNPGNGPMNFGPSYSVTAHGFTCAQGWFIEGPQSAGDWIVDHNTAAGNIGRTPSIFHTEEVNTEGLSVTNNIFYITNNAFTIDSTGSDDSCHGKNGYRLMDCRYPVNLVFSHNLLLGSFTQAQIQSVFDHYAAQNYIPTNTSLATAKWFKYTTPGAADNNFHLLGSSDYISGGQFHGTDGKDVGADIDELEAAQGKVTLVGASSIASTSATIAFVAPDTFGCTVDYGSSDPTLVTSFTRASNAGGQRVQTVALSGLSANTTYYYRVNCAVQQPTGKFRTAP